MYYRSKNKNPKKESLQKTRETLAEREILIDSIPKSPFIVIEVIARMYDNGAQGKNKGVALVEVKKRRDGQTQYKTLPIPEPVILSLCDAMQRAAQTLDTM